MNTLTRTDFDSLIQQHGEWCVSVFMPTRLAGENAKQDAIRFKNLLRQTEDQLLAAGVRATDTQQLLAPAQLLINDSLFWQNANTGLAVFLSPQVFRIVNAPLPAREYAVVAHRFHLKPLLRLFNGNGRFRVLALSQNAVKVYEGTRDGMAPVGVKGMPASMEEALPDELIERQLQFHTRPTGKGGAPQAIYHGQGAGAELTKERLLRFFHQIDDRLKAQWHDRRDPLVLAAVDYLMPIYREANTCTGLLDAGIEGNPEELGTEELHRRAWEFVKPIFGQAQADAAARFAQLRGAGRASDQVGDVVAAAHQSRVDTLFVPADAQTWGTFDLQTFTAQPEEQPGPGRDDLLDLAAVQTYLHGGTVFVVDRADMPADTLIAAVFRY